MASPESYLAKVEEILGVPIEKVDGLQFNWETPAEGKQQLARIRLLMQQLRLVKKDVSAEMGGIRSPFRARSRSVRAGFLAVFSGRKAAGRDRARKREQLGKDREKALGPYERVLRLIDEAIAGLRGVELQIKSQIAAVE